METHISCFDLSFAIDAQESFFVLHTSQSNHTLSRVCTNNHHFKLTYILNEINNYVINVESGGFEYTQFLVIVVVFVIMG